jgi:hypothetical protein
VLVHRESRERAPCQAQQDQDHEQQAQPARSSRQVNPEAPGSETALGIGFFTSRSNDI